jgi:GTPase SAR1 family protein
LWDLDSNLGSWIVKAAIAEGVVLVYDASDPHSFQKLNSQWGSSIAKWRQERIKILFLGTKTDLGVQYNAMVKLLATQSMKSLARIYGAKLA